jgi:ribonuclease P protein component
MLRRANRFHGYNSLRIVYQKGQTVRGPLLSLRCLPSNRVEFRCAVVVSRKISKSAVVRGRIRRRVFEQVRLSALQLTGPYDLVWTAFSDQLATLPASELKALVEEMLSKAGVTSGIVNVKESKN